MGVGLFLIGMLVWGIVVGWIGQLLLGRARTAKNRDWQQAMIAGVAGSFLGGAVGSILMGEGFQLRVGGIVGSVVGAIVVLLIWGVIAARRT